MKRISKVILIILLLFIVLSLLSSCLFLLDEEPHMRMKRFPDYKKDKNPPGAKPPDPKSNNKSPQRR